MKRKQWMAALLALVLMLTMSVPALAADTPSEEVAAPSEVSHVPLEDAAQTACTAAMAYGAADSISWAVWEEGEITTSGSFHGQRDVAQDSDGTVYGMGSVSKIFTTTAVMQLVDQHRISLDAPVTQYLPEFRMADPRYRQITVRMLLNHSSGLMGSSLENGLLFDDPDPAATDTLLERLATQTLKADPGAYSVYCNDGFTLAELVVEAVSGQDFMDYVREHILAPAGLEHVYAPADAPDAELASIYTGTDPRPLPQDCLNAVGAGGMYATAEDLAAFGGILTENTLLSREMLDKTAEAEYARGIWPEDTLDSLAYGLGWDNVQWYPFCQSDIVALTKGGDTLYYHAALVVLPEYHMAAAVLTSGGLSTYNQLAATRILITALEEQGIDVDETIPALPDAQPAAMPAELMQNSGYYGATAAQYRISVSEDGVLAIHYLNYPAIPDQTFTYYSDGSFRDATGTAALRFVQEDNGQTYLYQKSVSPVPELSALPVSNYTAVKLEENDIPEAVQDVWDRVAVTSVLPVNEKYSSQVYLSLGGASADTALTTLVEMVPGYIGGSRIVDETTARYTLQIPGTQGRDGQNWTLVETENGTWLQVNGSLYMPQELATDLYTGSGWAYTTVGEAGYARWYQVGDAAGSTMTVQLPENAGFWVYDASGAVTASSVLWDETSAVLPEGGMVVFAGDPGARFHLRFS